MADNQNQKVAPAAEKSHAHSNWVFEKIRSKQLLATGQTDLPSKSVEESSEKERIQPTSFVSLDQLLKNNQRWAKEKKQEDPEFFQRTAAQQKPHLLWIGCSDSRVPANQIVALAPGEVFVHRNIANVVTNTDLNSHSVIQYAVEVLKVSNIIVTGHYGCGGVIAAMQKEGISRGLIDGWLMNVKDVYEAHSDVLEAIEDEQKRTDLMCELNVAQSVMNVAKCSTVQKAWARGQNLSIHGWCYRLNDGLINDLDVCVSRPEDVAKVFQQKKESQK